MFDGYSLISFFIRRHTRECKFVKLSLLLEKNWRAELFKGTRVLCCEFYFESPASEANTPGVIEGSLHTGILTGTGS